MQDEGPAALKRSLMAALYHNLKINDLERRRHFSHLKIGNIWEIHMSMLTKEGLEKPHHVCAYFEALLLPLFERYTLLTMLKNLLAGLTTNDFNRTLWNSLPKLIFTCDGIILLVVRLTRVFMHHDHRREQNWKKICNNRNNFVSRKHAALEK